MNVEILTLCKNVIHDKKTGFLSIIDSFDIVTPPELPVNIPAFVVAKIRFDEGEKPKKFKVSIISIQENLVCELEHEFPELIKPLFDCFVYPIMLSIEKIPITAWGKYIITLDVDGVNVAEKPFFIPRPVSLN